MAVNVTIMMCGGVTPCRSAVCFFTLIDHVCADTKALFVTNVSVLYFEYRFVRVSAAICQYD
jgi:hypothetical protein